MVRFSPRRRDTVFFDLFLEAGVNAHRAAEHLAEMIDSWPEASESLTREVLKAEQEGDRITHDIVRRLNTTSVTPIDRADIYALAKTVDDVVDYTEEAADLFNLYKIEAPMEQANSLAEVLVAACERLSSALGGLRSFEGLEEHWIAIHKLENDGDRISRDAVASLFAHGVDPMVVIHWKDIFATLERAIDATEAAAHILEGIVIKNG